MRNTFIGICLFIHLQRAHAGVKNQTGEAHFWELPSSNWGRTAPVEQFPPLVPPHPTSLWWGLSDDRNVCTLDASILIVLDNVESVPITGSHFDGPDVGIQSPIPPSFFGGVPCSGPSCGVPNAVRMKCADIATMSRHSCTNCCKMASRYYGITGEEVYGVLINSAALGSAPISETGSSFKRSKRAYAAILDDGLMSGPSAIPSLPFTGSVSAIPQVPHGNVPSSPSACGSLPCPTTKCMCCGPRRPFTGWLQPMPPPFIPKPSPIWPWQPVGQAPTSK